MRVKLKGKKDVKFSQIEKYFYGMVWSCQSKEGDCQWYNAISKVLEFTEVLGMLEKNLKFSHGWLEKFKARHGIACYNILRESSDVDAHGVGVSQARLPIIIAIYDLKDVFNFDEMGLYYKSPPSKTLNVGWSRGMKKEKKSHYFGALYKCL